MTETSLPAETDHLLFAASSLEKGMDEIEALLGLGAVCLIRGLSDDTAKQVQRALVMIEAMPEPRLQAQALRLNALVAMRSGNTQQAQRLLLFPTLSCYYT